jgi:hypothetical protein
VAVRLSPYAAAVARRRLTSTIGSVAQIWRDPTAEPESVEESPEEMRVTCAWCVSFDMSGPVEEVREKFRAHLALAHPDVDPDPPRRRRRRDTRKA